MLSPFRFIVVLAVSGVLACLSAGEAGDPVLAVVGQTQIRASQVDRGIPGGAFGASRKRARTQRLARLVDAAAMRQAIVAAGVMVDEAAIDTAFAAVSKQAPAPPCDCCAYRDFDDYLGQWLMTRDDARAELWNRTGLDLVINREWEKAHPDPEALATLVRTEGPAVRAKLRRYWHIGCWSPSTDAEADHQPKSGPVWDKVMAARQRIQAGTDFATVAQEVSENPDEAKQGGFAGILSADDTRILGVDARLLADLQAGAVSEPLPGLWSFHLIRWEPLRDAEILERLKSQFFDQRRGAFVDGVMADKQVEYRGAGQDLAPKATAP